MRIPWTDKMTNGQEIDLRDQNKADEVRGACSKKGWSGSFGIYWKDQREEEQRKKEDVLADKS